MVAAVSQAEASCWHFYGLWGAGGDTWRAKQVGLAKRFAHRPQFDLWLQEVAWLSNHNETQHNRRGANELARWNLTVLIPLLQAGRSGGAAIVG